MTVDRSSHDQDRPQLEALTWKFSIFAGASAEPKHGRAQNALGRLRQEKEDAHPIGSVTTKDLVNCESSGDDGTRTHDPLRARQVL